LAAAHLGATAATFKVSEPSPTAAKSQAFEANELVRLVRDLAEIGDTDDLGVFLKRITEGTKTPADYALTARLARAVARPDIAVFTAKRASYAASRSWMKATPSPICRLAGVSKRRWSWR